MSSAGAPIETRLVPAGGAARFIRDVESRSVAHRAPMPGGELAIRGWGDPSRPPLVLLHGGFGSWRHWIANVLTLSKHYHVMCVDLPGLGDSDTLQGDYVADRIASTVHAGLMHLLGSDSRFFIAGFSFGGIVGAHVAALAGHHARGLVTVAPGALGLDMYLPTLESLNGRRSPDNVKAIHRINLGRLMIHDPARIDELAIEVQLETVKLARARSGRIPHSDAAARALTACACPIAGVWGEHDVIAARHMQQRRELFRRIQPGCPFHVVQGAGHWVMYERPERFNPLLAMLLRRLGRE